MTTQTSAALDVPQRVTKGGIALRYSITERRAKDLIREAMAAHVAVKRGRFIFARPSEFDAWLVGVRR
jgi:hypothetical protein